MIFAINKKIHLFFAFIFLLMIQKGFSQDSISLADHSVAVKELAGSNDSLEIDVTLVFNNLINIDYVEVKYGSDKGDFFDMNLQHVFIEKKEYLKFYETLFPVINGNTVVIKGIGSQASFDKSSLYHLMVKDYWGNKMKVLKQ